MNITLDNEQKLFVITTGNSVSCLGFDVVYQQARELYRRLKAKAKYIVADEAMLLTLSESQIGTLEQYEQHRALMANYLKLDDSQTWFDARTPAAVQLALESARKSGSKLRVFCGDTLTGRDWMDEYDTIGTIGRSCGAMKAPLMVPSGDVGGPALLTHCIVRLIDVTTGDEVYRHPKYYTPKMAVVDAPSYDAVDGITHSVMVESKDGVMESYAHFKSYSKAAHWVAFMAGHCHVYSLAK